VAAVVPACSQSGQLVAGTHGLWARMHGQGDTHVADAVGCPARAGAVLSARRIHGAFAAYLWKTFGADGLGRALLHFVRGDNAEAFAEGADPGTCPSRLECTRALVAALQLFMPLRSAIGSLLRPARVSLAPRAALLTCARRGPEAEQDLWLLRALLQVGMLKAYAGLSLGGSSEARRDLGCGWWGGGRQVHDGRAAPPVAAQVMSAANSQNRMAQLAVRGGADPGECTRQHTYVRSQELGAG
jgi:hypothetical protein